MLRINKEEEDEDSVTDTKVLYWRKVKRFFGPTGGYIKWNWCLFCPLILSVRKLVGSTCAHITL